MAEVDVPAEDIERYLGTAEARIESNRTAARWIIDGFAALESNMASPEDAAARLTQIMMERMRSNTPVHTWPAPDSGTSGAWPLLFHTVADVMSSDLFTVRPQDVIDLATHLMHWKHFRHVPVESKDGTLQGLIAHRSLLQLDHHRSGSEGRSIAVADIMDTDPLVVRPDTPFDEALDLILSGTQGCLLVVDGGSLVGIATERDFLRAAAAMRRQVPPVAESVS